MRAREFNDIVEGIHFGYPNKLIEFVVQIGEIFVRFIDYYSNDEYLKIIELDTGYVLTFPMDWIRKVNFRVI